jgi:hypothetical protein
MEKTWIMFNTISWQSYWTTLAISVAIYYLIILLLYYRKELRFSFERTCTKAEEQSFILSEEEFQTPSPDSEEAIVYSCMDELNAFFEEAKKRRWNRSEMMHSLQSILKKYPAIRSSGYKQSVTNVLRNQCEHICSIHLDKEELEHVWLGW